jgi:hypothetical protein
MRITSMGSVKSIRLRIRFKRRSTIWLSHFGAPAADENTPTVGASTLQPTDAIALVARLEAVTVSAEGLAETMDAHSSK